MKNLWLSFAIAVILTGCATEEKFRQKMDTWIGASMDDFVLQNGVPDSEYETSDGRKIYQFGWSRTETTGGFTYTEPVTTYHTGIVGTDVVSTASTTYVTKTAPVATDHYSCVVRLVTSAGIINSYQYEGNDCVAE